MDTVTLQTSIEKIPRIGVAYAKKLKKFGIKTVQDLLFYFPARYDDFSEIISISQARNKLGEVACVQGEIIEIETTKSFYGKMAITKAVVQDRTAQINVLWFNQPYLEKSLKENDFWSQSLKGYSKLFGQTPQELLSSWKTLFDAQSPFFEKRFL